MSNALILAVWLVTNTQWVCSNVLAHVDQNFGIGICHLETNITEFYRLDMGSASPQFGKRFGMTNDFDAIVRFDHWDWKPGAQARLEQAIHLYWQKLHDDNLRRDGFTPSSTPGAYDCTNFTRVEYLHHIPTPGRPGWETIEEDSNPVGASWTNIETFLNCTTVSEIEQDE
jgi:hypothetical protein